MESIGLQAILDDKNFQAGLSRYTAGIGQMTSITDGAAKAIGGAFKLATGALLIGVGGIGAALAASVKAAADAEQIGAQTNAVLQSTKGVAGMTAQAVGDLATALSEVTPFEDDMVQSGENMLLTFTNIGKNVFPDVTEVMLDMSQAMGQDVKSSALQLGKALQDPAEGLSALSRVGVKFTKEQENMVKALVKAGKTEEAQRVILKELQTEFGGAARAAGKTFAGQLKILQNALGNILETIGGALLPTLTKLATAFNKALASPTVQAAIRRLVTLVEAFGGVISDLFDLLTGKQVVLEDFAKKFGDMATAIGLDGKAVEQFVQDAVLFLQRLGDAWNRDGLSGVIGQLAEEFKKAWPAISATLAEWGSKFWNWLTGPGGALEQAGAKLGAFAQALGQALKDNWPAIQAQFATWKDQFWNWLTGKGGAIDQVGTKVLALAALIRDFLKARWDDTIWPEISQWPGRFWQWLTGPDGVLKAVSEQMAKLAEAIKRWSEDPATQAQLQEYGRSVAKGVIDGIGKLFDDPGTGENIIQALIRNIENALQNLATAIVNLGTSFAAGVIQGIAELIVSPEAAATIASTLEQMWRNAFAALTGDNGPLFNILKAAVSSMVAMWNGLMRMYHWTMPWDEKPPAPDDNGPAPELNLPQYARGGWVARTGLARVHVGEYVIPARPAASGGRAPINIVNNWPDSIAQMDRPAFEQIARRAAYTAIADVMGAR